jgi:hypothetical protein
MERAAQHHNDLLGGFAGFPTCRPRRFLMPPVWRGVRLCRPPKARQPRNERGHGYRGHIVHEHIGRQFTRREKSGSKVTKPRERGHLPEWGRASDDRPALSYGYYRRRAGGGLLRDRSDKSPGKIAAHLDDHDRSRATHSPRLNQVGTRRRTQGSSQVSGEHWNHEKRPCHCPAKV